MIRVFPVTRKRSDFFRKRLVQVHNITIGTAGHIDHGKSELISRLTGIHPDRLKEEKERGMTIDLGYSFYETAGGLRVGIIDVPGHERFIKNMVAGATSMDLVILVVAADDGVMPQTREHLNIMTVLGIRKGVVALTKIDLVDEEMVELAQEDVRDLVQGTFLQDTPIVPVSSVTGAGIDDLRALLDREIDSVEPLDYDGIFRMPIQRVFSSKGFGTVVTGVPVSGSVRVGDILEILPRGDSCRVRGIQAYGEACELGRAGHRNALNITDVNYRDIRRGFVAANPGIYSTTTFFEAELYFMEGAGFPLRNRTEVRVHTGTSEVMGRVVLLDRKVLNPGESSLVQLRLRDPVVVVPGDRYILRLHSPLITIGGGAVVGLTRMKLKRFKDHVVNRVEARLQSLGDLPTLVTIEVEAYPGGMMTRRDLATVLNRDPDRIKEAVSQLMESGDLFDVGQGLLMERSSFEKRAGQVMAVLEKEHEASPLVPYIDVNRIRSGSRMDGPLLQGVLKAMEARGVVETAKGGLVRKAGFEAGPTPEQQAFIDSLEASVRDGRATPPAIQSLVGQSSLSLDESRSALEYLSSIGRLVKIGGFFFHSAVLDEIRSAIREVAKEHGEVKIPLIRDRFETSRKYLIPLMEYFDGIGFTRRVGDKRYLKDQE